MKVKYRGKTFDVVKVDGTYNNYYLIAQLDPMNAATFLSVINSKTPENEHIFKEDYKGCIGMVPVDIYDKERNYGRFRLDAWMPDENKEEYERRNH